MSAQDWKQAVNEERERKEQERKDLAEAEARMKVRVAEVWTVLHEFEKSDAAKDASEFLRMLYKEGYVIGGYVSYSISRVRSHKSVPLQLGRYAKVQFDFVDSVWLFLSYPPDPFFSFAFTYRDDNDDGRALEKLLSEDPELDGKKILKLFTDFLDEEVKKWKLRQAEKSGK